MKNLKLRAFGLCFLGLSGIALAFGFAFMALYSKHVDSQELLTEWYLILFTGGVLFLGVGLRQYDKLWQLEQEKISRKKQHFSAL